MKINERSIPVSILLTFVTCGLYSFYWIYCILDDMYNELEVKNNAVLDVLLIPFTCGIYTIYLSYKFGTMLSELRKKYNMSDQDNSILFTILTIFGQLIITLAIVQDSLNTISKNAKNTFAITENNDN